MNVAAWRNQSARVSSGTPSSVGFCAFAATAAVEVVGAFNRNSVAEVNCGTPGITNLESQTTSTVVVSQTTVEDDCASIGFGAPSESFRADTVAAAIIIVGASYRNGDARRSVCAPGVSGVEGKAGTTVIISGTTSRWSYAGPVVTTPSLTSWAHTVTTAVIVVGAFSGNEDASVQCKTPRVSG